MQMLFALISSIFSFSQGLDCFLLNIWSCLVWPKCYAVLVSHRKNKFSWIKEDKNGIVRILFPLHANVLSIASFSQKRSSLRVDWSFHNPPVGMNLNVCGHEYSESLCITIDTTVLDNIIFPDNQRTLTESLWPEIAFRHSRVTDWYSGLDLEVRVLVKVFWGLPKLFRGLVRLLCKVEELQWYP